MIGCGSVRLRRFALLALIFVLAAGLPVGGEPPAHAGPAVAPPTLSTFVPVTPSRVLDTRNGTGTNGAVAPLGPGGTLSLQVAGVANVPSTANAVVLTLTAVNPTASGFMTVYPDSWTQSDTSNLDFSSGQTTANLAIVQVADGAVDIYNKNGYTDVLADVSGYYLSDTSSGTFDPVGPTRALDTRNGTGTGGVIAPLSAGKTIDLQVTNVYGVPANATAVVLNLTVTNPTAGSFLTVYPDGSTRPNTSNIDFGTGQTVANLVVAQVTDGSVDIWNKAGSTDVVADIFGYYSAGAGSMYVPQGASRLLDTRDGTGNGGTIAPLQQGQTLAVQTGVPSTATAVVLHVTAVNATAAGFLTVWPDGPTRPNTSNVDFAAGQIASNLVIVSVTDGVVDIWNKAGTTDVVVDIFGYYGSG